MTRRQLRAVVAAAICVAAAGGAVADTIKVVRQNKSNVFATQAGTGAWSQNVQVRGRVTAHAAAGPFRLSGDGGIGDFIAFCVDLDHFLKVPGEFTLTAALFPEAVTANISALVSNAFAQVADARSGAAFQMALWEIVEDSDAGGFDLASGDFSVGANPSGKALAQGWLSRIASGEWRAGARDFTFLRAAGVGSAKGQDLVAVDVAPIPLPATALLLGAALGAFGLLRGRRGA